MALSAYGDNAGVAPPRFLQDYLTELAEVGRFPKSIVVHPLQGYADRMKAIVTGFMVAVATRRNLYVKWPYDPPLEAVVAPRLIPWTDPAPQTTHKLWWLKTTQAGEIAGDGDMGAWLETHILQGHDNVLIESNQNWIPHLVKWMNETDPSANLVATDVFRALFHTLFAPAPDSGVTEAVQDLRGPFDDRFIIGVHIRAGSNGQWKDPDFETDESVMRFDTAVRSFMEKTQRPGSAIYLSTDSARIKDRVRAGELFGGLDVFQQDIIPFHVRYKSEDRDATDVLRETVIDHYALSCCDYIFRGHGQFALTAAMLGHGLGIEAA